MKAARRSVVWSARQDRVYFLGCMPLELSRNPFMAARRKARYRGKNSGYRLPNQRRAYQCLSVYGVRIWANKPRQFKGVKWRARCATVARFVDLCEFRAFRAWRREGLLPFVAWRRYLPVFDDWCATCQNLDAPDFVPAGGCFNLVPFRSTGDGPPQMVIARGGL